MTEVAAEVADCRQLPDGGQGSSERVIGQQSSDLTRIRQRSSVFRQLSLVQVRKGPCQSFISNGDHEMAVRQLRV
jgi:hypothetical protein